MTDYTELKESLAYCAEWAEPDIDLAGPELLRQALAAIEALEGERDWWEEGSREWRALADRTEGHLKAAEARLAELERAVEPFSRCASLWHPSRDDEPVALTDDAGMVKLELSRLSVSDFRRLAQAYRKEGRSRDHSPSTCAAEGVATESSAATSRRAESDD